MSTKVLLTGVTGFLGSHTTIQLLNQGFHVIGTMRDLSRKDSIRKIISKHADISNLELVEADLTDKGIWQELVDGIDYVQHIASPFPRTLPKNDVEIVKPAVEGTLNVLKASKKAGVKRVVLTSSSGAIIYGKKKEDRNSVFNEEQWTDSTNKEDSTPYFRSKTLAEKAAWDFVEEHGGIELTTICPGAILGPVLEKDFGTSANIVIKTMDGSTPAIPRIGFDMVDVRSVAKAHYLAMINPEAKNERFIISEGFLSFKEVADTLRKAYPNRKIPKALLPNFMVRLFSNIDSSLKPILIDLGTERKLDHSKAETFLNWVPSDPRQAVLGTAESVVDLGIV